MEKETFVQALLDLALAQATMPPYTAQAPLDPMAIESLFEQADTASEVLDVVHDNLRALLSTAKEPLIHLLQDTFSEEQLERVAIFINPAQSPRLSGLDHTPYLLIDDPDLSLNLTYTPVDLHIYAHPKATLYLTEGDARIYGHSCCHLTAGDNYSAHDFAYVEVGKEAQCFCQHYSVCHALDGSMVNGAGFSTLVKCGDADIHTFENSRMIVHTPDPSFTMHRRFRPMVQTQPELSVQYAYTHALRLETSEPLTLHTQHELKAFEEAFTRHPGEQPYLPTKTNHPYSIWQLADLFDSCFQSIDMGLCDLLESVSTKEEITDVLAQQFGLLRPRLGITFIREQFDAQQLADAQIFIDDTVRIQPMDLQGEFFVFGHHIVDQPSGTIGYYYDQTIAHVQHAVAYLHDNSTAIGTQSLLYGLDNSLIYGRNVTAQIHQNALGSFHGESMVLTQNQACAYLYDQTEAKCYHNSQLVLMDKAQVVQAIGGTIYGDPEAILEHTKETTLYTDKQVVEQIRKSGFLRDTNEKRNTHQIHH